MHRTASLENPAVIRSLDDYESLIETLEILADPRAMAVIDAKSTADSRRMEAFAPHFDINMLLCYPSF